MRAVGGVRGDDMRAMRVAQRGSVASGDPATARRMTRLAQWRASTMAARSDVVGEPTSPSSVTKRNAGSATRCSRQARRPAVVPAAGSVAASKARRCPDQPESWRKYLVPTTWVNRRCGGRVLGETQHRDVEGIAGTFTKPPSETRRRRADEFERTPSESGRSGRIQGARAEASQVHASRTAARAPDPREAHHANQEQQEQQEQQ